MERVEIVTQYWLMKSEPSCFSISDLQSRPMQIEPWDGVRNYQARNFMREMRCGDKAFFYHSSTDIPGIVGTMKIVREAYPDPTQFDPNNEHYDVKSTLDKPRWDLVEVKFERAFNAVISLAALKAHPKLGELPLVQKGNRLSVMPVTKVQWQLILAMAS